MRTTQDKVRYHLERMEHWQVIAERYEAEAARKGLRVQKGRMSRADGLETDPDYAASVLLRDSFGYSTAVGNRNAHQRQVEIYALAHLVGVVDTPYDRTPNGLVEIEAKTED